MIRCSTVVNSPQCYHGGGTQDVFHSRLFVFVNFGSTVNRFLIAYEPPAKEARVAESFIDNPQRFYSPAGGYESGVHIYYDTRGDYRFFYRAFSCWDRE